MRERCRTRNSRARVVDGGCKRCPSKRISNEGREAQSCQACAFKMGQPKVGEGPLKLLQAPKRVMPEGSKLRESKLRWLGKVGRSGGAAKRLRSEYSRVSRSTSPWGRRRDGESEEVRMAKMAKMGEYWGKGQGVPKQREVRSRDNVVGIISGHGYKETEVAWRSWGGLK